MALAGPSRRSFSDSHIPGPSATGGIDSVGSNHQPAAAAALGPAESVLVEPVLRAIVAAPPPPPRPFGARPVCGIRRPDHSTRFE